MAVKGRKSVSPAEVRARPRLRDSRSVLTESARAIVSDAAKSGLATPAFASSLSYFDTFRSERMPSNLIQAQRDFFGAHTYERIGFEGVFHTEWSSNMKA